MSEVNLPYKTEREAKIAEIKGEINALYLKLKVNQTEFSVLSRKYAELLKELEIKLIEPNF